jgi:hypothetical protein
MVEIQENYKEYVPPKSAFRSIKRLIRNTPKKYFTGLDLIHLTNTGALNRKLRKQKTKSRKRKVALNESAGWYVEKWNNEPARIELLMDKIYYDYPTWALKISFITDVAMSRTFFHELGHHIHKTQAPEHIDAEDVADKWKRKLSKRFFWKKYWYILCLLWPFKPLLEYLLKKYDEKEN